MPGLEEVAKALYEALAESRGTTSDAVRTDIGVGGEIDSLEGVELVVAAEEQFGVQIKDAELSSSVCSSIPRLARLIVAKVDIARRGAESEGRR